VNGPDMQWVDSSNVEALGYDSEAMDLYVQFKSGSSLYIYENVPESTFHDLMSAPSKGSYLNREIKPNYHFRTQ
jgi:KTSC domain